MLALFIGLSISFVKTKILAQAESIDDDTTIFVTFYHRCHPIAVNLNLGGCLIAGTPRANPITGEPLWLCDPYDPQNYANPNGTWNTSEDGYKNEGCGIDPDNLILIDPDDPESGTIYHYPLSESNPLTRPLGDYVGHVLSSEIHPNDYPVITVQALAIASRTYILKVCCETNNTSQPFSFSIDQGASDAVQATRGEILQYHDGNSILTEYRSDHSGNWTGQDASRPHLQRVYDPGIYEPGDPGYSFGMMPGFSDLGACRWIDGYNSSPVANCQWPSENGRIYAEWDQYAQLLTHYYTGVHLFNADTSTLLTPSWRWHPITIEFSDPTIWPQVMNGGQSYNIDIVIQNSGTSDWNPNAIGLTYWWETVGGEPVSTPPSEPPILIDLTVPAGEVHGQIPDNQIPDLEDEPPTVVFQVAPPTNIVSGDYMLVLDMQHVGGPLFSEGNDGLTWPTYRVPVVINNLPTPTPPATHTPTPSVTPTPSATPTPNQTPTPTGTLGIEETQNLRSAG